MSDNTDSQPKGSILDLVFGFMPAQVVYAAASLGIADFLGAGPRTSSQLAEATGANGSGLRRLLRGLAVLGVVEETKPDSFALTEFGSVLRVDHPNSVRAMTMAWCSDYAWDNWGHLIDSVKTGKPVHELTGKEGPFEYMESHPEFRTIFNAAMSEVTRNAGARAAAIYDFSQFGTLVDVGGGDGTLISAILERTPGLKGILVDLPAGLSAAPERLRRAGVLDRCEIRPQDMFQAVPEGADAYMMKSVIHDWNDERSGVILRNCRQAMKPSGRLLLLEPVVPAQVDMSPENVGLIISSDLDMLVCTGGLERTEAEFAALLRSAGFDLVNTYAFAAPSQFRVIEAVPA
jgi:hypothetical protein